MVYKADSQNIQIRIPTTGGPASVVLAGRTDPLYVSPSKLGSILANVQDHTETAEWHDFLESAGIASMKKGETMTTIVSLPQMSRKILFSITDEHEPHEMCLRFPPMLALFTWKHGKYINDFSRIFVSQTRVGAVTDPVPLFTPPWGNVRHPNGTPCWGSVVTGALSPMDPRGALELFYKAPFNNHLMSHNLRGPDDPSREYDGGNEDFDNDEDNYDSPGLGTRFLHWAQSRVEYPGTLERPVVLPFPVRHEYYRYGAKPLSAVLTEVRAGY